MPDTILPSPPPISFTHINKCGGTTVKKWLASNELLPSKNSFFSHSIVGYDYMKTREVGGGMYITPVFKSRVNKLNDPDKPQLFEFKDDVLFLTMVRNPYDRMGSHFSQWERNRFFNDKCSDLDSFISTLAKFYEKGPSFSNMDMIIGTGTLKYFTYNNGTTESIKYRPAIDNRFVMPCTFWIRDIDRFTIFKLEDNGLNNIQHYFSDLLKDYSIKITLSNILDKPENINPDYQDSFITSLGFTGSQHTTNTYKHLYNKKSIDIINNLFHDDFETFGYDKI
jgi:hypothetical protein